MPTKWLQERADGSERARDRVQRAWRGIFVRNGEVFAYVGTIQNLKDLKPSRDIGRPAGASGELIRSLSRDSKWGFGVWGATMLA